MLIQVGLPCYSFLKSKQSNRFSFKERKITDFFVPLEPSEALDLERAVLQRFQRFQVALLAAAPGRGNDTGRSLKDDTGRSLQVRHGLPNTGIMLVYGSPKSV